MYSTKRLVGYAPFRKGTDEIAWDYAFGILMPGNKNAMFIVFEDGSLHDAEISLSRYNEMLLEDFEMRRVEIRVLPYLAEDEQHRTYRTSES